MSRKNLFADFKPWPEGHKQRFLVADEQLLLSEAYPSSVVSGGDRGDFWEQADGRWLRPEISRRKPDHRRAFHDLMFCVARGPMNSAMKFKMVGERQLKSPSHSGGGARITFRYTENADIDAGKVNLDEPKFIHRLQSVA